MKTFKVILSGGVVQNIVDDSNEALQCDLKIIVEDHDTDTDKPDIAEYVWYEGSTAKNDQI